jgi:hypothetical protein
MKSLKFIRVVPCQMDITTIVKVVKFDGKEWLVGYQGYPWFTDEDGYAIFKQNQLVRALRS